MSKNWTIALLVLVIINFVLDCFLPPTRLNLLLTDVVLLTFVAGDLATK